MAMKRHSFSACRSSSSSIKIFAISLIAFIAHTRDSSISLSWRSLNTELLIFLVEMYRDLVTRFPFRLKWRFRRRHHQNCRHNFEKNKSDPRRNLVRERITSVNIKHKDGYHDGKRHKDHREEKIFANQRNNEGCWRNYFRDDKEENCESKKNGDAKRDLFAWIWR